MEAGLTPEEALRSATSLPARLHQMLDRGTIAVGMQADFVILKKGANPLEDITDTRKISRVWVGGVEFKDVACNASIYLSF